MKISKEWLLQKIIAFLIIIHDCRDETIYANDRSLYSEDLFYVTGWLKKLEIDGNIDFVLQDILSPKTDKHFDYWRQGEWGEREMKGLSDLRKMIQEKVKS